MAEASKNLLSILVIPFKLPTAVKFEYSGEYKIDDPSVALMMAERDYLEKNFSVNEYSSWNLGSLDSLDFDGTPSKPFIEKMFAEMPTNLTSLVEKGRWWCMPDEYIRLVSENKYSSVGMNFKKPLATALELYIPDNPDLFCYLIIHIECEAKKADLDFLDSLNSLHNTPLKNFLDKLIELGVDSKADPFLGIQGLIPRDIRRGILIIQREAENESFEINDGVLEITVKVDRKNKARFKTKYSFLGLLVSIQKDQIGCIRSNWPSFSVENLEELTTARIKLGEFINHWWWARVFADDNLRVHYSALQDAFGLQSQVESYRSEINDLWNLSAALDSKKSYLNSSRLNTIVLVAAIIGVIPGWVSILFSQSQIVASLLSATVFIVAFATWKLINRSRRSTQYRI
jgi:hypothetical protein